MSKVYYWDSYWQTWSEILGYDKKTEEIIFKRITPINNDVEHDEILGKIKKNEYMKLDMKFLSLSIIERENKKYEKFCEEIFTTCREAYRILHFQMNIPNTRFNKEGCIERRGKK